MIKEFDQLHTVDTVIELADLLGGLRLAILEGNKIQFDYPVSLRVIVRPIKKEHVCVPDCKEHSGVVNCLKPDHMCDCSYCKDKGRGVYS